MSINHDKTQCDVLGRGVGRWFGKEGLYRSIGKGSMISVYKIEPSYVTIRKHRGAPAPRAPMVPTPMPRVLYLISLIALAFNTNEVDCHAQWRLK